MFVIFEKRIDDVLPSHACTHVIKLQQEAFAHVPLDKC